MPIAAPEVKKGEKSVDAKTIEAVAQAAMRLMRPRDLSKKWLWWSKPRKPLVNIKIGGTWVFISPKMEA